jgi:long-chain acyl-CoA synthetase
MVEVPVGEVGEIIIKGDCVMRGYFGKEDATNETIINGWLKSGDLGRVDEEGFLYIVDRIKDLIISKGINIYPREIEELIYQIKGVDAVAVIGVKDEIADEVPTAFIQIKEDFDGIINEQSVKKELKKTLANFKIPKKVYFVKELPKNATGKVLKRVLKEQLQSGKLEEI